jgi:methyl-accepting chemotaxis protein
MFNNLKFTWKFNVLMVLIPITAFVVAIMGILGSNVLKAQYDNLYGFMLIPINNIQNAQSELKDVYLDILNLNNMGLTAGQRTALVNSAKDSEKQISDIMTRYNTEWISTASPDFTAELSAAGKASLQTDEANALKVFNDGFTVYAAQRDAVLSGSIVDKTQVTQAIDKMNASLTNLINVNMSFADVSNTDAQNAIDQMRLQLIVAGILISLLAIGLSLALSRSVVKNLRFLTGAMSNLAKGNLNRDMPEETRQKLIHMKDEIGDVGRALHHTDDYLIEMSEVAQKIAQGDLTSEVHPRSDEDELGIAFEKMIDKLRLMVANIASSANDLGIASFQLAESANQAGQATSQIATTIQQVAKGTNEQAESVNQTAASVEHMNRSIEQISNGSQEQSDAVALSAKIIGQISASVVDVSQNARSGVAESERTAKVAQDGADKVTATVKGMHVIREKVSLSADKVQEMGRRSEQISQIVETIDDIAGQTNLLALNAAIEAARAGEQGKGFAVVADEVRKLAERSSKATKEISGIIHEIQTTVKEAVVAMDAGSKEVENGVLRAQESGEALAEILSAAKGVNQQIQTIAASAKQMGDLSGELVSASDAVNKVTDKNTVLAGEMETGAKAVVQSIESIASVSEENSAAVEEVSASVEEMSAQVEEVSASTQGLADLAQILQQVVSEFVLPDVKTTTKQADRLPKIKKNGHEPAAEKQWVSLN